jgi:hypothetical protein
MKKYLLSFLTMVLAACGANASPFVSLEANPNSEPVNLPPLAVAPQASPSPTPFPPTTLPPATPTSIPYRSSLPNYGAAPELENEVWLNVDHPLRLADLRGKVVLLEMWTFG